MQEALFESRKDALILIACVLLMVLFILFGWGKLTGFSGTVAYMASLGTPVPTVAAGIAVLMEFFVGIAIVAGVATRPLALIFALYTLATGFIGHPFWTMTGAAAMGAEINFFKNVSIMGGLLMLCATGAGRYSIDHLLSGRPSTDLATR